MAKTGSSKASKAKTPAPAKAEILVGENRKARFHYEILDQYEAGLVLVGTEVKSLRQGQISLEEAYARIDGEELFLIGATIPEYSHGNLQNHEPARRRKCLLHKKELKKLRGWTQQKGLTLVPLRVYFSGRGFAKVLIGIGRGRKLHDKRQHLKDKEAKRELRGG
ncbi:MAG: SsrA-binding protein SmpB [Planctomycetes bacterium]|nr:SsrA-binding protein SmpB [Planctomycetota bacterium]